MADSIDVTLPAGGFDRGAAVAAVEGSGLPELLGRLAPGPFGLTATATHMLEALADAADLGLAASAALRGILLAELSGAEGFQLPELAPGHERLLAAVQLVVAADDAVRRLGRLCPHPEVHGALEMDGLEELLNERDAARLARRQLAVARGYLELKPQPSGAPSPPDEYAGTTLSAALQLLAGAVRQFARSGSLVPLVKALAARRFRVAGFPYDGLAERAPAEESSGLLPVAPEDIVGNAQFLEAGLRLARDVAGYDVTSGSNPKTINPVLFGLGPPGCGKTVTAHAVGNYFMRYCREREVPARFVVVRRSDWASSYQNASAANLIRMFREEVYGFSGVCGVYWPDIDTALASRASPGLRIEEKQNLGAVFGVFDGTLLPRDGKWFMICDANTLHMDEAAVSRIAQSPCTVDGPTTPEHYVRLMRDLCLREVRACLPSGDEAWRRIGQAAATHGLSGRNVAAVCGNVRSHIQDFEYPDRYFQATGEERRRIVAELSRPVDEAFVLGELEAMVAFQAEAREREESARFEAEVDAVVRRLNASRAAVERAGEA
ncbi:MAG: AAA family ATPase [Acidobacteriota bacterium]